LKNRNQWENNIKMYLEEWDGRARNGLIWLVIGASDGSCELIPGLHNILGFFSIYLILPAALGPVVYSGSIRNEYQKQKNNISGE
jgi:hypothetical protein